MLDNIIHIPLDGKDMLNYVKANHEKRIYKHYWNFTHDEKFLYLYQKALKDWNREAAIIETVYLKDIDYKKYYLDYLNNIIVCWRKI